MLYFFIIFSIIFIDFFMKKWVIHKIPIHTKIEIVKNRIYLWHIKNKGVAYNRLARYPRLIIFLIVSAIAGLIFWLVKLCRNSGEQNLKLAFSFLIGGAIANLIDRVKHEGVTDFIYIKSKFTPIFNIADVFILIGGIFCILAGIFTKEN